MKFYEFISGTSHKVWAIAIESNTLVVYYGKSGNRLTRREVGSGNGLQHQMQKRISEQIKQGYEVMLGDYVVDDDMRPVRQSTSQPAQSAQNVPPAKSGPDVFIYWSGTIPQVTASSLSDGEIYVRLEEGAKIARVDVSFTPTSVTLTKVKQSVTISFGRSRGEIAADTAPELVVVAMMVIGSCNISMSRSDGTPVGIGDLGDLKWWKGWLPSFDRDFVEDVGVAFGFIKASLKFNFDLAIPSVTF